MAPQSATHQPLPKYLITIFQTQPPILIAIFLIQNISPLNFLGAPVENSFFCAPSDREDIVNLIHRQKNKSTDLINMPVFIQKILAPIISPTVSMLFNNSVSKAIFPECIKIGKSIPILKSGDSNSTVNYRPISMLPFLSKIFEKLMCAGLDSHLKSNNILCTNQFRFTKIQILQMQLLNSLIMFIHYQTASRAPLLRIRRFLKSIRHS